MLDILFTGLGSIGSRHIQNLAAVLRERGLDFRIDALRATGRPLREEVSRLVSRSFADIAALDRHYDVAFVTNPTSLHEQTVRALAPAANHLFIEKPVFSDAAVDPATLGLRPGGVYYVACPLRHTPVLRRVKELCETRRVAAARAICSTYLPDWRPGTDYRECYSARAALGGGVVLDLIHEWDYLSWLFGLPEAVCGFSGKHSGLEIDSEDTAVYAARYPDKVLSLYLDYIGRVPRREIELYCDEETFVGDITHGRLLARRAGTAEELPREDFYRNEMNYFIDCVLARRADHMNTIPHALAVLQTALRAKETEKG